MALAPLAAAWPALAHAQVADLVYRDSFETAVCGNGAIEETETCDDGNADPGDGCSAQCVTEANYVCNGEPSVCGVDCSSVPTPADAGFLRTGNPTTWMQLTGAPDFPAMNTALAAVPHNVSRVYLGASRNRYTSVQFTVPSDFTTDVYFDWDASQIAGTSGQSVPSPAGPVTISSCPGDFRVGITSPVEPTEHQGCKSIYVVGASVTPRAALTLNMTGQSSDYACGLLPGHTYYLNYTNANPLATNGGVTAGEWTCPSDANSCGVQFAAH